MRNIVCEPCAPNAQDCVKSVMRYLADISYKKIITGQHTQTMEQEELHHIEKITGKQPALLGFELLSYSPNINYLDTDDECMNEVEKNLGTLKRAWEWAREGGLITFCWHWFSPLGGRSKSFFTRNTDFDAAKAIIGGTDENKALLYDIDCMAGLLRPFCEAGVPILWRPFHEAEGDWFWWGAKGGETVKALWRIMFGRFNERGLNNLIWVWNATKRECYPGDEYVDIVSRDMYPPPHEHTSQAEMFRDMTKIADSEKIILIGETGTLPSAEAVIKENAGWASFMTWSNEFCLTEEYTTNEALRAVYESEYAVTRQELPRLYEIKHV